MYIDLYERFDYFRRDRKECAINYSLKASKTKPEKKNKQIKPKTEEITCKIDCRPQQKIISNGIKLRLKCLK